VVSVADDSTGSLRRLLDGAPSAVLALDGTGTILYANHLVEGTLGYAPEELVGRPADLLVPPRHRDTYASVRDDYLPDPYSLRSEGWSPGEGLSVLRKDGTEAPVEVRLTPMPLDTDRTWVVVALTDIGPRLDAEDRVRRTGQAYLTLAQLNQAVVRATDEESLYADACRVAVEHGGYLGAWVGQAGPDGKIAPVATAGMLDDYVAQLDLSVDPQHPEGNGPTARTLRDGAPYFSASFLDDEATAPWHELGKRFGIAASATLPLRCDGRIVAVLTLYSGTPGLFDELMRGLLGQVADNISYALGAFADRSRLQRVAVQRSDLLRRLVTAQEAERARIAGDVHDDSIQALAAVDLRLGLLQRQLAASEPELRASLTRIQSTVAGATAGLRQLLFDLEPPSENLDCAEAVREAAAHIFEDTPTTWRLHCESEIHLPDTEQLQAIRIVKEALINARKHAQASTVEIDVRNVGDGVEVTITDDGTGFDPAALDRQHGHRGLETMHDRAEATGGWCTVGPAEGGGTQVRFWVPRAPRTAFAAAAQP
jgi:PAS domain S-box-containing protein